MQILLAAATTFEIAPFVKKYPAADILITGVGAPVTIYHLTKRIQLMDYDLVIQAGIAGIFTNTAALGEVVSIESDTFADVGIKTKNGFSTIFEEGLADLAHPPYHNGWLINTSPLLNIKKKVKGITVNTITDDMDYNRELALKYGADIESMEGAALHYVCLSEAVPFLQLRAVSNHIGERDKSKWMMKPAIENLNKELGDLYEGLLHGKLNPV